VAVKAGGQWILIDGGSGTLQRMTAAGIDYKSVRYVLYTHRHTDHTADLAPLLFALNFTPDFQRSEPLEIYGPPGISELVENLQQAYPWVEPRGFRLEVKELSNSCFSLGTVKVESAAVAHGSNPAVSYRIGDDISVVISGDTGFCDPIVDIARGCDCLVLEASVPTVEYASDMHLTAPQAGMVARMATARNLVLYHFYPLCDEYDMRSLCAGEYDGRIIIAEDLMRLTVDKHAVTITSRGVPRDPSRGVPRDPSRGEPRDPSRDSSAESWK